jgi:hypothetical protein
MVGYPLHFETVKIKIAVISRFYGTAYRQTEENNRCYTSSATRDRASCVLSKKDLAERVRCGRLANIRLPIP